MTTVLTVLGALVLGALAVLGAGVLALWLLYLLDEPNY